MKECTYHGWMQYLRTGSEGLRRLLGVMAELHMGEQCRSRREEHGASSRRERGVRCSYSNIIIQINGAVVVMFDVGECGAMTSQRPSHKPPAVNRFRPGSYSAQPPALCDLIDAACITTDNPLGPTWHTAARIFAIEAHGPRL